jgi:hypothetical protein
MLSFPYYCLNENKSKQYVTVNSIGICEDHCHIGRLKDAPKMPHHKI